MGLHKEIAVKFEQLEQQQQRIWPDACDLGYDLEKYPEMREPLREIIRSWIAEGLNVVHTASNPTGEWSIRMWKVFLPWEMDADQIMGTEYTLYFEKCKGKDIVLLSSARASKPRLYPIYAKK